MTGYLRTHETLGHGKPLYSISIDADLVLGMEFLLSNSSQDSRKARCGYLHKVNSHCHWEYPNGSNFLNDWDINSKSIIISRAIGAFTIAKNFYQLGY